MVSTRRKSYQPAPVPTRASAVAATTRARHSSLSDPPVAASPRRSRRASSLTPFESEGAATEESSQTRGHRTKVLLEKYREEAAKKLKPVQEETQLSENTEEDNDGRKQEHNGGKPVKAGSVPVETVPTEATTGGAEEAAVKATGGAASVAVKGAAKRTRELEAQNNSATTGDRGMTNADEVPQEASECMEVSEADEAAVGATRTTELVGTVPAPLVCKDTSVGDAEHAEDPVPRSVETNAAPGTNVDEEDEEVDVEGIDGDQNTVEQEAARRVAAAQRVLASVVGATTVSPPVAVSANTPAAVPVAHAPGLTRIRPAPVPRGMAKSGRFWKSVRTRASTVVVRDSVSYEVRMQKRQRERAVKDLENQLKNERKQKLEDLRKRREYNTKKAAENALKAEVYQVVKNPNKIKRMKKKQLRLLQKRDTTVVGKSVIDE